MEGYSTQARKKLGMWAVAEVSFLGSDMVSYGRLPVINLPLRWPFQGGGTATQILELKSHNPGGGVTKAQGRSAMLSARGGGSGCQDIVSLDSRFARYLFSESSSSELERRLGGGS